MGIKRTKIRDSTREEVIKAQGGRCALCSLTHPTHIHHIVPARQSCNDAFDNLVLLCQNHHDLADSGVISPDVLKYYKQIAPSGNVHLDDPTFIYELTVDRIVRDLLRHYDPPLLELAHGLLQRLQRLINPRYRRVCLELIFGIIYASMHEEKPNIAALEKLERKARKMAKEMGTDGLRYQQLITHYIGVLYHNAGRYQDAKKAFEYAVATSDSIVVRTPDVEADKNLARVRETASDHLSGASDRALDHLLVVIAELPTESESFADTYCFAQVKLAEHMIVRHKYERAQEILETTSESQIMTKVLPLYRVILLKDLGRTYVLLGNCNRGVRLFVKAIALAEAGGFRDQRRKIIKIARELNIDISDLEISA